VLEEYALQKLNASDVVLVTDADKLREYAPQHMFCPNEAGLQ
jgi:hypothetical protein